MPSAFDALESFTSWINFRSDVPRLVVTAGCRYILAWPLVLFEEANLRVEGDRARISRCTRTLQIADFAQRTREVFHGQLDISRLYGAQVGLLALLVMHRTLFIHHQCASFVVMIAVKSGSDLQRRLHLSVRLILLLMLLFDIIWEDVQGYCLCLYDLRHH